METLKQAKYGAADLHWLATLLTGCRETATDVTMEAIPSADDQNSFFSTWMYAWSRRLVIAKALAAIRNDLARSARQTELKRAMRSALPPRSWALDQDTTKSDLERALLAVDVFPRAAVLLLVFERVAPKDAAVLLNVGLDLVRKAQAGGLRELTINLARMQGWKSAATKSTAAASELQHA